MEMIGILKRQTVIVLLFICFFPTMAVAQVDQFKLKQVLQDANAGDISACAYLGKMYYEGTGVAQNYNEAFKCFQKAADNGVTGAYTWLGVMYYDGQGVAQNYEKAFLWTKKAAENGAANAYVGLGVMYCKGQGVAKNSNEAFKWFQKAADNGVASAFAYLGDMYYAGDGVAQNYNEALKWYQKAADNGITTGIYLFLADMFYTGKTGITDYSQAKKYAELAIKNDTLDIVGHRILAKLYMYGYAVEKNIDKAEALIEQALAHCKKDGSSDYPCNTMDVKGELFWVMGDKVKAKEIYESINKNAPDFYAKIGETELSKYMKAYKEVDVDDDIPIVAKKNEKVFAVVIANEKYQMEKAVQYAKNDGRVFAEYCRKTLGLPEKNIHYVTDATLNNLKYELKWLQNVMKVYRGEAKVIFYYAGHGIPDEQNKNGYLLPIDGYGSDVTTGYALDDLFKTLGNMPSKSVTIFLDACFSGAKRDGDMLASTRGVAIKVKQNAPQGNMVVFSAAQGDETAYPYNEFEHGLFTYYLLKKLQETKGDVTLGELGDYIKTKVEQQSIVVNGKLQSPSIMSAPLIGNDWKTWKLNK